MISLWAGSDSLIASTIRMPLTCCLTRQDWLTARGMQAMDGPINCGERDRWWGLVVEGFSPPGYCMNYNPPYYQELFESYGFKNSYNQICFSLKVNDRVEQKFYERHDAVAKIPGMQSRHLKKNDLKKFALDFTIVYNKAWAGHGGLKEMKKRHGPENV